MVKKIIMAIFIAGSSIAAYSQKTLNQAETGYINEASSEFTKAISDLDIDDATRVKMLKRSAKTLKEYGQANPWPSGSLPIEILMEKQYKKCQQEVVDLAELTQNLNVEKKEKQIKIINEIQINVLEDEIQLLIPNKPIVDLSIEAVNSIFGLNIAEGANKGKKGDVIQLKNKFKELQQLGKLYEHFNILLDHHKESLRLLDHDRKEIKQKAAKWKIEFNNTYNSAFTFEGYENAQLYNSKPVSSSNVLIGVWKFGYPQIGYFYWSFLTDGTWVFEDKMNDGDKYFGTYSVSGNLLKIVETGKDNKIEGNYFFKIEDNKLEFTKIEDMDISRRMTLQHTWSKD